MHNSGGLVAAPGELMGFLDRLKKLGQSPKQPCGWSYCPDCECPLLCMWMEETSARVWRLVWVKGSSKPVHVALKTGVFSTVNKLGPFLSLQTGKKQSNYATCEPSDQKKGVWNFFWGGVVVVGGVQSQVWAFRGVKIGWSAKIKQSQNKYFMILSEDKIFFFCFEKESVFLQWHICLTL